MDNRTIDEIRNNEIKLIKEIEQLKKQLDYLRNGEYLNQLKFERDMLQDVVDNMTISEEDKEFIDMTHRNTELLEENLKYIRMIKKIKGLLNDYEMQGNEIINLYCKEIRNCLKEV